MAKFGYTVQGVVAKSEGYSSKWLIWLVGRESLTTMHVQDLKL